MTGTAFPASSIALATPWSDDLLGDAEIEAIFAPAAELIRLRSVMSAWIEAGADVGELSGEASIEAKKAVAETKLPGGALRAGVARDGVVVPVLVELLRDGLPAQAANAIHNGMTSQDVLDASATLRACAVLDICEGRLVDVVRKLTSMREAFGDYRLPLRTRYQHARDGRAGVRFDAWVGPLYRSVAEVEALRTSISQVAVGGPAGEGVEGDGPRRRVARYAERLGLRAAPQRHAQRDGWFDLGAWHAGLCGALGKIGVDICLMAQGGDAEIDMRGLGGSSSMPHKRNPVKAEALVAVARCVGPDLATLQGAMLHEQERSGSAWTAEWIALPRLQMSTGVALYLASEVLSLCTRIGTPNLEQRLIT